VRTVKFEELPSLVGEELGHSEWHDVTQERVDAFADVTGDHQWIHVDRERAAAGPFGGTIAHGYLTLSLLPALMGEVWRVDGVRMGINYGLNRVRFPSPVPVGSRVRAVGRLKEVTPVDGGVQAVVEATVEVDGASKPACVAETVVRFVG
jgi:acyl dehydratase